MADDRRLDQLLLFIGLPGGAQPADQIRVMKGLFLFSQEGPDGSRDTYRFEPYNYGPFETGIYRDIDRAVAGDLVSVKEISGTRQKVYRLTSRGDRELDRVMERTHPAIVESLTSIKQHVTTLSFLDLLRDIYARYPEFAARSVARV